jgi:hypothetical protein
VSVQTGGPEHPAAGQPMAFSDGLAHNSLDSGVAIKVLAYSREME